MMRRDEPNDDDDDDDDKMFRTPKMRPHSIKSYDTVHTRRFAGF
jgi:hypothetical protein